MNTLLVGMCLESTNYCCFLCELESKVGRMHYIVKHWPRQAGFISRPKEFLPSSFYWSYENLHTAFSYVTWVSERFCKGYVHMMKVSKTKIFSYHDRKRNCFTKSQTFYVSISSKPINDSRLLLRNIFIIEWTPLWPLQLQVPIPQVCPIRNCLM